MKALIIGGFLASGKTTFVNSLLSRFGGGELKGGIALLINEFGEIPVDGALIDRGSYSVQELTGGCICCSLKGLLADAVADIKARHDPELLIIEATGLAVPSEIALNVGTAGGCSVYSLLCIDPEQYQSLSGKLAVYDRQLEDAEVVLLTKCDLRDKTIFKAVRAELDGSGKAGVFESAADAEEYLEYCLFADGSPSPVPAVDQSSADIHEAHPHREESGLKQDICEYTWKFPGPVSEQALGRRLDRIVLNTDGVFYRIKGIVRTPDGRKAVQYDAGRLNVSAVNEADAPESFLVFICRCSDLAALRLEISRHDWKS